MSTRAAHLARTGLAALSFFTLLASDFWRYSIGWWGYLGLCAILTCTYLVMVIRRRREMSWKRLPAMLGLFLFYCLLSTAWSNYPGTTLLAVAAQWATALVALGIVFTLSWPQIVRSLANALRWIVALSIAFELWVAIFVQHAVLPLWVDYGSTKIPAAFYWSRGLLFEGGPIQGIMGNRNLLGFIALIALIVFSLQLVDRTVWRGAGIAWLALALITLALTRSSTVTFALVVVVVGTLFALWARRLPPSRRLPLYWAGFGVLVIGGAGLWWGWQRIADALGKSADFTGRVDIWNSVIHLAQERAAAGWGWISYWAPWVEPYRDLAVRKGVTYLQAHNAWLDVWMQLGVIGVVIFALLVGTTLWRSWFIAIDRPRWNLDARRRFHAIAMIPLLIMLALIAQSFAESRMLIEGGWLILVSFAVVTKFTEKVHEAPQ